MTVLDILGVWNLFMTLWFIPVYSVVYIDPCLKLPALSMGNHRAAGGYSQKADSLVALVKLLINRSLSSMKMDVSYVHHLTQCSDMTENANLFSYFLDSFCTTGVDIVFNQFFDSTSAQASVCQEYLPLQSLDIQAASVPCTQYICSRLDCYTVLTHWGWDKMDAIFQTAFSNGFPWMKMYEFGLKFHWSLFLRVQLIILQHWFR